MKKYLAILALALLNAAPAMATIIGSHHDFSLVVVNGTTSTSSASWNSRAGVCSPCHTAHETDENQLVPLWAHYTTTSNFTMYSSPSLDATQQDQPSSASKACLSCHDGTVAIGTGLTGSGGSGIKITSSRNLGTDLHTTHPISITYDKALSTTDVGLFDPTTTTIAWSGTVAGDLVGKTIQNALLKGTNHDQIECSSCHDPHKSSGVSSSSGIMARISGKDANGRGSTLCRTCHNK